MHVALLSAANSVHTQKLLMLCVSEVIVLRCFRCLIMQTRIMRMIKVFKLSIYIRRV